MNKNRYSINRQFCAMVYERWNIFLSYSLVSKVYKPLSWILGEFKNSVNSPKEQECCEKKT